MKKLFKLGVLVLCMSLLTGCLRYNIDMSVNSDKSMKLSVIYAIDQSMLEGIGGNDVSTSSEENNDGLIIDEGNSNEELISEEDRKEFEKKGFTVKDYKDENYEGVILTKDIANIDDVTSKEKLENINMVSLVGDDENEPAKYYFYKEGNDYVANFIYNEESYSSEEGMNLSAMANSFDINYSVTLPNKSISNNATKVSEDGKTLTWKMDLVSNNTIQYRFNFGENSSNKFDIVGFVKDNLIFFGGGLLIILVLIILIINSKRKSGTPNVVQGNSVVQNNISVETPVTPVTMEPTPVVQQTPIEKPVVPVTTESVSIEPTPVLKQAPIETPVVPVTTESVSIEPTPVVKQAPVAPTDKINNNQ